MQDWWVSLQISSHQLENNILEHLQVQRSQIQPNLLFCCQSLLLPIENSMCVGRFKNTVDGLLLKGTVSAVCHNNYYY